MDEDTMTELDAIQDEYDEGYADGYANKPRRANSGYDHEAYERGHADGYAEIVNGG